MASGIDGGTASSCMDLAMQFNLLDLPWWGLVLATLGLTHVTIAAVVHLAKVRNVAPTVRYDPSKTRCDVGTVQAVITHRYDVLAKFARSLRPTAVLEDWCGRAEDSGIGALRAFSRTLRCYDSLAGEMR